MRDLAIFESQVNTLVEDNFYSEELSNEIINILWNHYKIDEIEEYGNEYARILNKIDTDINNLVVVYSFQEVEEYKRNNSEFNYREYVITDGWLLVQEVE